MSADDMQLGQTEVCTDSKSSVGMNNIRHNHTHSATHNHGHNHLHGVLIGTMQSYGNNLIESFKTEPLCQVQCMDCQKVRSFHDFHFDTWFIFSSKISNEYSHSISIMKSNWLLIEWFIIRKQIMRLPSQPPAMQKRSMNAVYAWKHSASTVAGGSTKSATLVNVLTNATFVRNLLHSKRIYIGYIFPPKFPFIQDIFECVHFLNELCVFSSDLPIIQFVAYVCSFRRKAACMQNL